METLQMALEMFLINLKAVAVLVDREHVLRDDLTLLISMEEVWMKIKY